VTGGECIVGIRKVTIFPVDKQMPGDVADPPKYIRSFIGTGEMLDYLLLQGRYVFPVEAKILF